MKIINNWIRGEPFVFNEPELGSVHCQDCWEGKRASGSDDWIIGFARFRTHYKCISCGLEFTGIKGGAKTLQTMIMKDSDGDKETKQLALKITKLLNGEKVGKNKIKF